MIGVTSPLHSKSPLVDSPEGQADNHGLPSRLVTIGLRRPLRSTPRAGNRYFTVNGADAVTFSHSMRNFPLAPLTPDSVILRVSTGDDGLPMVSKARPSSVAGSLVVAPSRMPSGDTPTPQM